MQTIVRDDWPSHRAILPQLRPVCGIGPEQALPIPSISAT